MSIGVAWKTSSGTGPPQTRWVWVTKRTYLLPGRLRRVMVSGTRWTVNLFSRYSGGQWRDVTTRNCSVCYRWVQPWIVHRLGKASPKQTTTRSECDLRIFKNLANKYSFLLWEIGTFPPHINPYLNFVCCLVSIGLQIWNVVLLFVIWRPLIRTVWRIPYIFSP